MKQTKEISSFFERITVDNQLYPSHISIFVSLFQSWSVNSFQNPFRICRENVMKSSKIKSFATYHKCIKDLHNAGYIIYSPNYNSYKGSLIEIIDFETEKVGASKIFKIHKILPPQEKIFSVPMLYEIELYFEERNLFSFEAEAVSSKSCKVTIRGKTAIPLTKLPNE